MKTKLKRQGSAELPRFAVGALAIAGASAANAATVQITFNNSYVSSTAGSVNLDADFGNDGLNELNGVGGGRVAKVSRLGGAVLASAYGSVSSTTNIAGAGIVGGAFDVSSTSGGVARASKRGLVALSFTDSNIRSGALTTGYLDMTATASQPGEKRITVNRLIFDIDTGRAIAGLNVNNTYATYVAPPAGGGGTSAVPEASTSLGLLALGAGGILTRRRSKRAA